MWDRKIASPGLELDDLGEVVGKLGRGGWGVLTGVGNAEPTAEVQFGQHVASGLLELGEKFHGASCRDLETTRVEDL